MSLGQLLELAINGNRLHLVSTDAFHGLEHLRILYLAGNHITRLEDYTFRGLQVCVVSIPAQTHLDCVYCAEKFTCQLECSKCDSIL